MTRGPAGIRSAPGLDVVGAGARVPLAAGGTAEYANLDHGASAPALRVVKETVDAVLERYASVHRGAGWHSKVCTSLYEGRGEPVRSFVGGRADDAVIFTRHTTDSFNLLAHCLPARTTVVVFETEHHAALLPWSPERTPAATQRQVVRLPAPDSAEHAVALVDHALRRRTPGPALLVITGASNVTGEVWPVAELARVARSRGARVALDAAQLAPHRPFSIEELGVDYVALSGHKLYAPYGAGALIGRADWLAAAPPYLIGGGATASVTDDGTEFKPLPDRHEAGSPNVPGAVALATACHVLARADREALAQAEATLTRTLRRGWPASPASPCTRCSASGRTASAWSPSPWPGSTRPSSRRHCPPSTASGCVTARSARIRWCGDCSARRVAATPPTGRRCVRPSAWAPAPSTSTGWCGRSNRLPRTGRG